MLSTMVILFFYFLPFILSDSIVLPSSAFAVFTKDYVTDLASIDIKMLNDTTALSSISYITILYEDLSTQTLTKDSTEANTFTYLSPFLHIDLHLRENNLTFSISSLISDTEEYSTDIKFNFFINGIFDYNKWTNETFTKTPEHLFSFYFTHLPLSPIYLLEPSSSNLSPPLSCSFNDTLLRAQCKYSFSTLPNNNIRSFILKENVYYEISPIANMALFTYTFEPTCQVVNTSTVIEISLSSSDYDISNYLLNVGTNEYTAYLSSAVQMNYSFNSFDYAVGSYAIKVTDPTQTDAKSISIDSQSLKIVNLYDIESIEPSVISRPFFRVTFVYLFDYNVKKSYQIRQDEKNTMIECDLVGNTGIDCVIPKEFHFYKNGSAFIDIGVYTCKKGDLELISNEIELLSVDIFTAKFNFDFPPYPDVGTENVFTLSTDYLYYIENITSIVFKVINYSGDEIELNYTKNDIVHKFTFNRDEYNITLNLTYKPGDYIELIEIRDTENTLTFSEGENVFKHKIPFIVRCPPLIAVGEYNCDIIATKWSNIDSTALYSIDITDSNNNVITYTMNDKASINLNFSQIDETFRITMITLSNGTQFINDDDNFLLFAIDALTLSGNELQFIKPNEFSIDASFAGDAFLLINGDFAFPCTQLDDSLKRCFVPISSSDVQFIDDFVLIFHYIYITVEKQIEFASVSIQDKCFNSIDEISSTSITINTFTDNRLSNYKMYLNDTLFAEGEQRDTKTFVFTFAKEKLSNGIYDSFTITDDNEIFIKIKIELFYYVDDEISAITYNIFNTNEQNQTATFDFVNDITLIASVKLYDADTDVDLSKKEISASECSQKSTNSLSCSFDMTSFFGYNYRVAFISKCNNVEYLTNHIIKTSNVETFLTVEKNFYYVNTMITATITPKVVIEVKGIQLINVVDREAIDIINYTIERKEILTFNAPDVQGEFEISLIVDGNTVKYQTITIVQHLIEFVNDEIYLPNESKIIDVLNIPLTQSVIKEQIEYIKYDSNEISYNLSDDCRKLQILLSSSFANIKEHIIIVKDKVQINELIYRVIIVQKPTITFLQSLFLNDSPSKNIKISISDINQINIERIYIKNEDGSLTTLTSSYEVDTLNDKEISFVYQVYDYFYDIEQKVIISSMQHSELFTEVKKCNFVTSQILSIDLTMLISNSHINNNKIKINVKDHNNNQIDVANSNNYIYEFTLEPGQYIYELFYDTDSLSFYNKTFTVTFFDTSRTAFNLLRVPFSIDFTDLLCDISLTQLLLSDESSIDIPLNCEYQKENFKLNCNLDNKNDINLLEAKNYSIMNSTELFHSIMLTRCDKKIDAVSGNCLAKCPSHTFNRECVSKCPFNTSELNSLCIDSFVISSQNESTIIVKVSLSEIESLIRDNIDDFVSLNKTLIGDGFAIQVYPSNSPIESNFASSVNTEQIEIAIQNAMNISSPLYIIKIDSFSQGKITSNVNFSIFTQNGEEIDKFLYQNAQIEISYPINESQLNLSTAAEFAEKGIDVFNAEDSFFNDVCFPFATENGTDVILSDRRKDFFQNVTLCASGCNYKGIDYTTKKVKCECNTQNEIANAFTDEIFNCNIIVIKCFSKLSKLEPTNIGLISCAIIFISMSIFIFLFSCRDFLTLKSLLNKKIISSPPQIDNQVTEAYSYEVTEKTFIEGRRSSIIDLVPPKVDTMVVGEPKEVENYSYKNAKKFDRRSLFEMFWTLYLDKEEITRMCLRSSQYECFSISVNYFIFNLAFNFAMNAIFFSDEQLSSRYKNGSLSFLQDMLRSIPSNIISFIVGQICKNLVSYVAMIDVLLVESKTEDRNLLMQKLYAKLKRKFLFFHLLIFTVVSFSLYYLTLFCIIYKCSQMSWFIGCIYSILISIIINISVCLTIAVIRKLSITFNMLYAYNIALFFKKMI